MCLRKKLEAGEYPGVGAWKGGAAERTLQDERLKCASLLKTAYYQLSLIFDNVVMHGLSALHYSVMILVFSRLWPYVVW